MSFLLTDRQMSMRGVVNSAGSVTSTVNYDAYGNVLSTSTGTPGEFGYAGYRYDEAPTGLYLDNARVYDPASGRWLSQDPEGFGAGDSNLYRYVNNNPVNGTDPSGFQPAADEIVGKEVKKGEKANIDKNTFLDGKGKVEVFSNRLFVSRSG